MAGHVEGVKSEVYAAIALHNFEVEEQLLRRVTKAKRAGSLEQFIDEIPHIYPAMRIPKSRVERVVKPGVKLHRREDYDVRLRHRRWQPTPGARVLLLLPCSQEKPYTQSQSFKRVWHYLAARFDSKSLNQIDIVFVSGLYGPVPKRDVKEEPVLTYDFLLHNRNSSGIGIVAERLDNFVSMHKESYSKVISYVHLVAYREVVRRVRQHHPDVLLLPQHGRMGQTALYRDENLAELTEAVRNALSEAKRGSNDYLAAD